MAKAYWASFDTLQQRKICWILCNKEERRHRARILQQGMTHACSCRPIDAEDIPKYVNFYRQGARNALDAGFDGVEVLFLHKKAADLHCILCARYAMYCYIACCTLHRILCARYTTYCCSACCTLFWPATGSPPSHGHSKHYSC